MIITVRMPPEGQMSVDLRAAAANMNAKDQRRLFKQIGRYISDEDCQRGMDDLAEAVAESRAQAAKEIMAGKWPVTKPIPIEALERFYNAQLPIVLSVCKKPEILSKYQKDKEKS